MAGLVQQRRSLAEYASSLDARIERLLAEAKKYGVPVPREPRSVGRSTQQHGGLMEFSPPPRRARALPFGRPKATRVPSYIKRAKKVFSSPVPRPRPPARQRGEAWNLSFSPGGSMSTQKLDRVYRTFQDESDDDDESEDVPADEDIQLSAFSGSPRVDKSESKIAVPGKNLLDILLSGAYMRSNVLKFASFTDTMKLCAVCKGLAKVLTPWKARCDILAAQASLYLPDKYPKGYKKLFFGLLWPSRFKWQRASAVREEDFKIRVAVRFRPGQFGRAGPSVVLPLHQRGRMIRQGKLEASRLFEKDTKKELLEALVKSHALDPKLIQAVLEAERLRVATDTAQSISAQRERAAWQGGATSTPGGYGSNNMYSAERKERKRISDAKSRGDGSKGTAPVVRAADSLAEALALVGTDPASGAAGAKTDEDEKLMASTKRRNVRVMALQPSQVLMFMPGVGVQPFQFDSVHDGKALQSQVYDRVAKDSVVTALNGFNACILCYGQTGSGKTYTMFGPDGIFDALKEGIAEGRVPGASGIVTRAWLELTQGAQALRRRFGIRTRFYAQYVQVYQEKVTDLLTGTEVRTRMQTNEDGGSQLTLHGAAQSKLTSLDELVSVLRVGEARKKYAETAMNVRSSRAHTILIINITQTNPGTQQTARSTLHLVDLAGSEKIKLSRVEGMRRAEAIGINQSLLALGKVIAALVESRSHVPYYDSKLTLLLRGAFRGNSRTTALVTCRPDDAFGEQTLHSLRFGQRAGLITNRAKIASSSVEAAVAGIQEALMSCQRQMRAMEARGNSGLKVYATLRARYKDLRQKQEELQSAAADRGE